LLEDVNVVIEPTSCNCKALAVRKKAKRRERTSD